MTPRLEHVLERGCMSAQITSALSIRPDLAGCWLVHCRVSLVWVRLRTESAVGTVVVQEGLNCETGWRTYSSGINRLLFLRVDCLEGAFGRLLQEFNGPFTGWG